MGQCTVKVGISYSVAIFRHENPRGTVHSEGRYIIFCCNIQARESPRRTAYSQSRYSHVYHILYRYPGRRICVGQCKVTMNVSYSLAVRRHENPQGRHIMFSSDMLHFVSDIFPWDRYIRSNYLSASNNLFCVHDEAFSAFLFNFTAAVS